MKLPPLPVILIDSNEVQHGHQWTFAGYNIQVANLYTGDYSLLGYEERVTVERKTKADWYGCLAGPGGEGRRRFRDCLGRLKLFESVCVIIEAGLDDLAIPPARTSRTAAHSIGAYISWQEEFGFPFIPAPSREWAERCALRWLQAFWRHLMVKSITR